jgi:hypothetical protein
MEGVQANAFETLDRMEFGFKIKDTTDLFYFQFDSES